MMFLYSKSLIYQGVEGKLKSAVNRGFTVRSFCNFMVVRAFDSTYRSISFELYSGGAEGSATLSLLLDKETAVAGWGTVEGCNVFLEITTLLECEQQEQQQELQLLLRMQADTPPMKTPTRRSRTTHARPPLPPDATASQYSSTSFATMRRASEHTLLSASTQHRTFPPSTPHTSSNSRNDSDTNWYGMWLSTL